MLVKAAGRGWSPRGSLLQAQIDHRPRGHLGLPRLRMADASTQCDAAMGVRLHFLTLQKARAVYMAKLTLGDQISTEVRGGNTSLHLFLGNFWSTCCRDVSAPCSSKCYAASRKREEGVLSEEVWGTKTLLQTNSVTTGVFGPNRHLALAAPQRQNLLCMFVILSFAVNYMQQK